MGAGASASPPPPRYVQLKGLPDAIDEAVFNQEKWPFIVDPDGDASRFLKYQRGCFLLGFNPGDMEKNKLRKLLVGCLQNGSSMTIKYNVLESSSDLTKHFLPSFFPKEILVKSQLLDEAVWSTLLRPDEGEPKQHEYVASGSFTLVIVSESPVVPPEVHEHFAVIHVGAPGGEAGVAGGGGDGKREDGVEAMFGAKEVIKNSRDLVDAAFDGDLEAIKALVDKGFHVDSTDGRGHSALSEAAAQGHDEVIEWLLKQGADPNLCNDHGRSPMYRAAFNGKSRTVQLLLEMGADQKLKDKSNGEIPYDAAKDGDTRKVLEEWDYAKTEALLQSREAEIRRKMEERIVTAADREALARQLITADLIGWAEAGNADKIKDQLTQLADEAERTKRRPLVTCEARNARGQTLLSLACQYGHVAVVKLLVEHCKTCDAERLDLNPGERSWEYRVFNANVNSRDNKGWNVAAIATFHEQKNCLRIILENGGDPTAKNSYNKNALDLAKDDLDAALQVVKSRAEIRSVLEEWDAAQGSTLFGTGKTMKNSTPLLGEPEQLPKDGTAVAMQLEMRESENIKEKNEKERKGGGGKKGTKDKSAVAEKKPAASAASAEKVKAGGAKKK